MFMRRVKYKEFKDRVGKESVFAVRMVDRGASRRRPRDLGEAEALVQLAGLSWDNAISSGKLQKKGARRYGLTINAR